MKCYSFHFSTFEKDGNIYKHHKKINDKENLGIVMLFHNQKFTIKTNI